MLVFVGHVGAYKIGLRIEDLAHAIGVIGSYGLVELLNGEVFGWRIKRSV